MDDQDDLLEPFQKSLLRELASAWKRSREPFSATSVFGWPKVPFRHPGLVNPVMITKHDFDTLAGLGYIKVSKPLYEGDLYEQIRVELSLTNKGVVFADQLAALESSNSVQPSPVGETIGMDASGETQMPSDIEIDGLLTDAEKDLVRALYTAWEIEPHEFVFPPFDLSKMESISQLPDFKTRVSATLPQLRHLNELSVVDLQLPPPQTRKGSAPGGTVSSTVLGRRYHRLLESRIEQPTAVEESDLKVSESLTIQEPQPTKPARKRKPRVFIGSSTEGLEVAKAMQINLDYSVACTLWSQGVFGLSGSSLESLVEAKRKFDYAILVLTPDDLTKKREATKNAPRDNVLFELGFFMGAFGRERVAFVYNRNSDIDLHLPSDLAGITPATYDDRDHDDNLVAALGSACSIIETQIKRSVVIE